MVKRKVGFKERAKIYADYVDGITMADLAVKYGRPKVTVEKAIKDHSAELESAKVSDSSADLSGGLRSKHFWPELRKQFSTAELSYFEKSWIKLIKQFSQYEVVETDEMIIKDLIIMDILGNRKLREIQQIDKELEFYQTKLDEEFKKIAAVRDHDLIDKWLRELSLRRGSLETIDKSYTSLQQRKETKFRDMKSTRDKRFKEIEDSKKTFFELIKMLDINSKRKEEGEWLALMKKSVENETARLGSSHKYNDDTYDQPLLSAETV